MGGQELEHYIFKPKIAIPHVPTSSERQRKSAQLGCAVMCRLLAGEGPSFFSKDPDKKGCPVPQRAE